MTKQIAKLLKATFQESSDLKQIAKELAGKGRGGDSMLVHITPKEAYMLKNAGGAGTINPDTGLLEFYDGGFKLSDYADFDAPNVSTGGYGSSRTASVPTPEISQIDSYAEARQPLSYEALQNKAAQQYSGGTSAQYPGIAYRPVEAGDVYEGSPFGTSVEFPYGMSSFPSLARARQEPPPLAAAPGDGFTPVVRSLDVPTPYGPGSPTEYGFEPMSLSERVKSTLTSPRVLENITMGGLAALPGIIASRNAAKQGQRARADMEKMATPYRQRSAELLAQAQSGELSVAEQQQLQAMQARIAQGAAGRGGPGAEQALNQLEVFRQQLLTDKYRLGLQVAGIADQIATGAIKAGLQADQYVSELTGNYFSNAMQMAMQGMTGNQPSMARRQLGA